MSKLKLKESAQRIVQKMEDEIAYYKQIRCKQGQSDVLERVRCSAAIGALTTAISILVSDADQYERIPLSVLDTSPIGTMENLVNLHPSLCSEVLHSADTLKEIAERTKKGR